MSQLIQFQTRSKLKPLLQVSRSGTATLTLGGTLIKVEKKELGTTCLTISYPDQSTILPQHVSFQVKLSNLGKGEYFQFLCPHTQKPCHYLYLIQAHFVQLEQNGPYLLSRHAYKHLTGQNLYFWPQARNRKDRALNKAHGAEAKFYHLIDKKRSYTLQDRQTHHQDRLWLWERKWREYEHESLIEIARMVRLI